MDQKIKDILDEVGKVIRGKDEQIQMVLDRAPSSVYTGCSSE